jgi:hypothetical protein
MEVGPAGRSGETREFGAAQTRCSFVQCRVGVVVLSVFNVHLLFRVFVEMSEQV